MKKKGFTLIELLAVIVIMAIIALIAVPIILNIIEKSKLSAFKSSILNGSNAIEYRLVKLKISNFPKSGINVDDLELKNKFKSGKYNKDINGKLIVVNITNGEYCANGEVKNLTITKGDCSNLLVLPENRMMESYLSNSVVNQINRLNYDEEYISSLSVEEVEKITNQIDELYYEQMLYFIPNSLKTEQKALYDSEQDTTFKIESIKTVMSKTVPERAIYTKDISNNQNESVMVWYLDEDNNSKYEMYIGQDGGVIAPQSCAGLFNILSYDTSQEQYNEEILTLKEMDLSNFDTSYVTNMYAMFFSIEVPTLDLSNFDTSNVANMANMFFKVQLLTTLDLSNFDTSNVTDMSGMFGENISLTTLNLSNFDTSNVENMSFMFELCSSLTTLNISDFDTSNVTNMSWMFYHMDSLTTLNLSNFDTSNVTDMTHMFYYMNNLATLNLSNFDTTNVTDMSSMFSRMSNLTTIDISNFDTSNVTDMTHMFYHSNNLTTIKVGSKWKTASTTTDMFTGAGTSILTQL